jgi:hypothetical protein
MANPSAANLELRFNIVLQNFGRSPAEGVVTSMDTILHTRPVEWKQKLDACMALPSGGKLSPGDVVFPGEQGTIRKDSSILVRATGVIMWWYARPTMTPILRTTRLRFLLALAKTEISLGTSKL